VVKAARTNHSAENNPVDEILPALLFATVLLEIPDIHRNFTQRIYARNCLEF
jgi:hypothetical protein